MKFNYRHTHGVILIAALILLLVITLVGISSMQSVTLAEKITSNMREASVAFQATENALSDGERWIAAQASAPVAVDTCNTPPCDVWQNGVLTNIPHQPSSWWQSNGRSYSSTLQNIAVQPRYIIEEFGFVPTELSPESRAKGKGYHYYRVIASGTGENPNAKAVIESIYAIQFN